MIISNNNRGDFPIMQVSSNNAISIIYSVANEENALASLIESEANILNNGIKTCITMDEFLCLNTSVIRTMKTVLQKNTVLQIKLRETLKFIKEEGVEHSHLDELLNGIVAVIGSIGEEEFSLGKLINVISLEIIRLIKFSTFENLINVHRSSMALMKILIDKNMILLKKLRSIVQFIDYIICDGVNLPDFFYENLIETIKNNLIESIYSEKKGLSKLIQSNSSMLKKAFSNCLSLDELLELKCITKEVLETVEQKNIILEYKLEEILTLIKLVDFTSCDLNLIVHTFEHYEKSVSKEEKKLNKFINTQANKINEIISSEPYLDDKLINANESLAKLLLNASDNLWQINNEVLNFIKRYS